MYMERKKVFVREKKRPLSPGQTIAETGSIFLTSLLDRTVCNRLAAHVGRCEYNMLCLIKCWIEFAFVQTSRPPILLDQQLLQCFATI